MLRHSVRAGCSKIFVNLVKHEENLENQKSSFEDMSSSFKLSTVFALGPSDVGLTFSNAQRIECGKYRSSNSNESKSRTNAFISCGQMIRLIQYQRIQ